MSLYESDSALFIQILHDYTMHQQTLENVQSAKYLGIKIKENKDWCQHISDISSIATKTLGCRHRNGFHKEVAYKTLVRPKLESTFLPQDSLWDYVY